MTISNVPKPSFSAKGFVAPAELDVLDAVTKDFDAAFGGGLNPAKKTPQGQLATTVTAYLGYVNDTFTHFTNQVDPAYSEGRMQDAIARIYFLERIAAQPTVVQARCTGLAGTLIPAGAQAADPAGNIYENLADAYITGAGFVFADFANIKTGSIPCVAGSLTQIYRGVTGWDTITNPIDGVLGRDEERRDEFEARRYSAVAKNSNGMLASIRGAVLDNDLCPGVIDCYVAENDTPSTVYRQGVYLVPNSIFVVVLGGASADIAQAIFSKKMPGCAYTGDTTVQVTMTEGYSPPYPVYSVTYQIARQLEVAVAVTILSSPLVPDDAQEQVRDAVVAAMAGQDGRARPKIAAELLASRLYPAITALGTWAQIVRVKIGAATAPAAKFLGSVSSGQVTATQMVSGAIATGQFVFDATGVLPAGVKITGQISGTPGGLGVYSTNETTGLAAPASLISTVAPSADAVLPNLDQAPVTSRALITMTLGA